MAEYPWVETIAVATVIVLLAFIANWITKGLIRRAMARAISSQDMAREALLVKAVIRRLANIVPATIILMGVASVPHLPLGVTTVVENVASAFIVLTIAMAISQALRLVDALYSRRADAGHKPIKGYLQVVRIIVYCGAAVLMAATLAEQSPLLLLSGRGAMAAVLTLVFKDTILSLVASVQLGSNDMLRVGDWIEMPQLNADGDVIDIALHTVKVQNWDRTITTIPTHRLISESFRNWRGMSESGGRRIKRALLIDQTSVRFLDDDEWRRMRRFRLIDAYLDRKKEELEDWNKTLAEAGGEPVNRRRATNLGTFRAYTESYLKAHAGLRQDMTLLVRQLAPSGEGLPLEIYCFTSTVAWGEYESIQSDIFDHLLAILPEFGLRLFQQPSGQDMRAFGAPEAA